MKINIKNNVYWVGKIDWDLRKFHGNEYSTFKGTTYNSYLIIEEKRILIDTVYTPFAKEYVDNLKSEINLKDIDALIINHAEIDHSGGLPELMELIPDVPVYCSRNGVKIIKGHYHKEWNFIPVKTGDALDVGNGKSLIFIEMQMLHWPDSMASYLTKDNILFSNDAFGQHLASQCIFDDGVDECILYNESIKYYANILTPFNTTVMRKINEILSMKIPIDMIAPSHGIIWKKDPLHIIHKYLEWSKDYQENQITIIYDTMWGGTKKMAESIAMGIKSSIVGSTVNLLNASCTDKNDIITEIFKSRMILIGSPTVNKGVTVAISGILEAIEGLQFKNKKAASFGCYGWSGESIQKINDSLRRSGFKLINDGLRCLWNPDEVSINICVSFGNDIAAYLNK